MKVYVDELPKNCAECKFCGRLKPPAERPEIECMHCNMAKTFNSISPFCPLETLADHDKKVRKEVCEEIRQNAISHNNLEVDMYYITPQQLYEIEQGGEEWKD